MGSKGQGKRIDKYVPDYVVFDLETTGTSCKTDQVVEISGIKVVKGEIDKEFSSLVNPMCHIPYYASQVNGITDDMVEDCPIFESVLSDFLAFAGDLVLVGHNIHTFDMKFLYRDADQFYGKTIGNDYIDTLWMARRCLPQLSHHKLTDLAEYYGVDTAGAHRALQDCRMNQIVYERLGKEQTHPSASSKNSRVCPRCGNMLKKRSGRYGDFWGCMSYPDCRYTENI